MGPHPLVPAKDQGKGAAQPPDDGLPGCAMDAPFYKIGSGHDHHWT